MSDFLSSLAARSLGAAPALVPRQASRFEPGAAPAAEPETWGEVTAEVPARGTPRGAAPGRVEHARAEPHRIPGRAPAAPRRSPPAAGEPISAHPAVESRQGVKGDEIASPSADASPSPSVSPSPSTSRRPSPRSASPDSPIAVHETRSAARPLRAEAEPAAVETIRPAAPDASPSPEIPVPTAAGQRAVRAGASAATRVVRGRETVREVGAPVAEAPAARMPRVVPRVELAPPRAAPVPPAAAKAEAKEEAAPVIQVSIGRIEVRAAQPAAPAQPPRHAPPPRTSLNDYLRNGARRGP